MIDLAMLLTVGVAGAALLYNLVNIVHSYQHISVLEARHMNGRRRLVALSQRRRYRARAAIACIVILATAVAAIFRERVLSLSDYAQGAGFCLIALVLAVDALLGRHEARHLLAMYLGQEDHTPHA